MSEKKHIPVWTRILLSIFGLLGVVLVGFVIWGSTPARPMPEALAALESDSQVSVTSDKLLIFSPASSQTTTGLILYPGGRVDYRAYAPAAHAIASQGFLVFIVPMPLNLAVFNPGAAEDVMAAFPQIQHWAVGGHSLGGSMAANFVYTHPGMAEGLVLWASYPAASNDLSQSGMRVLSISGTLDGLSSPEKIAASVPLLPSGTNWVTIAGGNHAQFGWYGAQSGDNLAAISREEQQAQIVQATVSFLKNVEVK